MSNNVFQPNEDVVIDAEFMERWLGGVKINSLSPKSLFDLQTLLTHYKDIIVPMEDVRVEYPIEGYDTACASVDEKRIYVPTTTLEKGLIDDTIGLVIHELNHIKHSLNEKTLIKVCSNFIMVALDTIFIARGDGEYDSLKELVFAGGFNLNNILEGEPTTQMEMYFAEVLKGVMLLLNSAEDVRIDTICPTNLKKYIDKLDKRGSDEFISHYESGELDENTLMNIVFRLLFHHKGFIHDEYINQKYGDTKYLVNTDPRNSVPNLLKAFGKEIKDYCESVYNTFDNMEENIPQSQANDYLQQMEQSSNEEAFNKMLGDDKQFADDCISDTEFEDSELDENKNAQKQKTTYQLKTEENGKLKGIPQSLNTSIQVFKNVDVVDCFEHFTNNNGDRQEVAYKTLLIG
tara:strand:- start:8296 stop:9507 length:1212 start_codon:yes stop_codon:yes gene_type:complete